VPRWSDEELLIQWVSMISPLICDGEPLDAVTAHLSRQIREDLAGRDDSGIWELIPLFSDAMREVAASFPDGGRLS
jgi:hypothetical protein